MSYPMLGSLLTGAIITLMYCLRPIECWPSLADDRSLNPYFCGYNSHTSPTGHNINAFDRCLKWHDEPVPDWPRPNRLPRSVHNDETVANVIQLPFFSRLYIYRRKWEINYYNLIFCFFFKQTKVDLDQTSGIGGGMWIFGIPSWPKIFGKYPPSLEKRKLLNKLD